MRRNENGYGRVHTRQVGLRFTDKQFKDLKMVADHLGKNLSETVRYLVEKEVKNIIMKED